MVAPLKKGPDTVLLATLMKRRFPLEAATMLSASGDGSRPIGVPAMAITACVTPVSLKRTICPPDATKTSPLGSSTASPNVSFPVPIPCANR